MGGVDDGAVREAQALEDAQGEQGQAAQATVTDADAAGTGVAAGGGAADDAGAAYEAAIAERDARIAELEAQVADAARTSEAADALRAEIAEVRSQAEADRVAYELRLAGVRSVRAAQALLDEHGGDVAALKEAEPWLFADAGAPKQAGKTGLPNAGAAFDEGKTMRRWREIAGLTTDKDGE